MIIHHHDASEFPGYTSVCVEIKLSETHPTSCLLWFAKVRTLCKTGQWLSYSAADTYNDAAQYESSLTKNQTFNVACPMQALALSWHNHRSRLESEIE